MVTMPVWLLVVLFLVALAPAATAAFMLGDLSHDMRRLAVLARALSDRLEAGVTWRRPDDRLIARQVLKEIERQLMRQGGVQG